ncbi:hypothetical protein LTR08_001582 [Meristemomyces frigidus]|nr:hypothetical protein LTR08_001582 [Meristemomyces frigidus]
MAFHQRAAAERLEELARRRAGNLKAATALLLTTTDGYMKLGRYCSSGAAAEAFMAHGEHISEMAELIKNLCRGEEWANETPATPRSTVKAREIFAVPELLEQILLWVHPMDVLNVMEVNRRAYDIICGSTSLQRHMNLVPDETSHFRSFYKASLFDFACEAAPAVDIRPWLKPLSPVNDQQSALRTFDIDAHFSASNPLQLGSRVRSMLICQPPVKYMQVTVSCCDKSRPMGRQPLLSSAMNVPQPVHSETGITVGDLYDSACELTAAHRLCPAAHREDHDDRGNVRVNPAYRATMRLCDEVKARRLHDREALLAIEQSVRASHYVRAKLAVKAADPDAGRGKSVRERIIDYFLRAKKEDERVKGLLIKGAFAPRRPTAAEMRDVVEALKQATDEDIRGSSLLNVS